MVHFTCYLVPWFSIMCFSTKAAMQRCTVLAESLVLPAIMRVEASGFAFTKPDGNGCTSCILIALLLYQNGYEVGKYISIENRIKR